MTVTRDERDADLVRAVAEGDRHALEELYARHAPWLVLRLTRRCNDRHLVDEAVQDTFVAVWRGARRWDGRLSPELRAVVQATVLDGLTTKEAGMLLGIPAGTVKTRMMRAKAQMREALA
jgi:RNA polymerase sigma-70 factor (ECF subfamily)